MPGLLDLIVDVTQATIMPGQIDYDKHGRLVRVKPRSKEKDSDNRSVISSSSRRHRDSSTSSSRTALLGEIVPQSALEPTSSTTGLDQLPKLPESDPNSPSSSSSPILRTISNVSSTTPVTSPTLAKTPIHLQPYLESDEDSPSTFSDCQTTPRPEKTKEQCELVDDGPKALIQPPISDTPAPKRRTSSESAKNTLSRSSSRTGPAPSSKQDQPPKQSHYRDAKHPEMLGPGSNSSTPAPAPVQPPPQLPYPGAPLGPQALHPAQYAYLQAPQAPVPSSSPPILPPQGLFYYPDYGPPPPPGQPPPQFLQAPPTYDSRPQDDGPMALLNRIHYALPDIYTLMDSYRDLCGIVESREVQARTLEAQRAAELRQHEAQIAQMEKDAESLSSKHSSETSRLRHEIHSMEKRCKDLQNRLEKETKINQELQAVKDEIRAEQKQTEKMHSEDKAALNQAHANEIERLGAEHRTNQRAMHDQLQAQIKKADATLSYRLADKNRAHEEEKQHLEGKWSKHRRELEDRHTRALRELEDTLQSKQKVVDEERRSYLQAREGWDKEREAMRRRFEEERAILQRASEEQHKALLTRFQREKDEILRQSSQTHSRTEQEESIIRLQREVEALRTGWDADKFRFQNATADFKTTARTLNEQNSKLQKLAETLADSTDLRGK